MGGNGSLNLIYLAFCEDTEWLSQKYLVYECLRYGLKGTGLHKIKQNSLELTVSFTVVGIVIEIPPYFSQIKVSFERWTLQFQIETNETLIFGTIAEIFVNFLR